MAFAMEEKLVDEVEIDPAKTNVRSRIAFTKTRRFLRRHIVAVRIAILALLLVVVVSPIIFVFSIVRSAGLVDYLYLVKTFVTTPMDKVEVKDARTNILILGKGGVGHEAPDLTDTMMFMSISHTGGRPIIISLPRDIWVPELRAKLNSAYYWGNQKTPNGGITLAKATVEGIVGQPVHYGVVVDMSGLENVVDVLGGIEVDVENAFTDNKFPVVGREGDLCGGDPKLLCRYEMIHFEKGIETMNGERALKFVRSRNAEGDEGTDFARAARQQRLIEGIQKKLLSREVYLSPTKIKNLLGVFESTVETDMSEEAGAVIGRRLYDTKDTRESYVLGEDLLVNPPISRTYDNLYVFIPRAADLSEIHEWVKQKLQ